MHIFNVSKDVKKNDIDKRRKEGAVRKLTSHLCLTLIIIKLKISVEHDRVVTTLNIFKY